MVRVENIFSVFYVSEYRLDEIPIVEVILTIIDSGSIVFAEGLCSSFVSGAVQTCAGSDIIVVVKIVLAVVASCATILAPSIDSCLSHSFVSFIFCLRVQSYGLFPTLANFRRFLLVPFSEVPIAAFLWTLHTEYASHSFLTSFAISSLSVGGDITSSAEPYASSFPRNCLFFPSGLIRTFRLISPYVPFS